MSVEGGRWKGRRVERWDGGIIVNYYTRK